MSKILTLNEIVQAVNALAPRKRSGLGCLVLALSSVGRSSYRLGQTDLEGRLAAFKEAGELEYTAYTALCSTTCQSPYRRL